VSTTEAPGRRTRSVALFDLRPGSDVYDPALDPGSKSPVIGVSFAMLAKLGHCRSAGELARLGREHRLATKAGRTPPPRAVDLDDWWAVGRWVLVRRMERKLVSEGWPIEQAQRIAEPEVDGMLAPIRALLGWTE
jgi:hypothetical protein